MQELMRLRDEILSEIDGGEECRGRDGQLSAWARTLESLQSQLEAARAEVERLRESWFRYKSDMRPETRNEFLRVASSLFDCPVTPQETAK